VSSEAERPVSLEALIEAEDVGLEILHPGGLQITRELAELCRVGNSSTVLDVASGTGESACYLAEHFGCEVTGVDSSSFMLEKARAKADSRMRVEFRQGDAHQLPFDADTFDAVISECTTCILNKEVALGEMMRVAKPGGYVGIHDLCWKEETPETMKRRLAELENERPETLHDWKILFERIGLQEVVAIDKSVLIPIWGKEIRRRLGLAAEARMAFKILRRSGLGGLMRIASSARIFQSRHTGYGLIVGRKP
jgi:arsenite methyltransferase